MLCGELVCVSLSEVSSAACLHAEEFREIKSEEVTGSRRCRKMCDTQCCESLRSSATGDTGIWSSSMCVAEVLGDHKHGLGEVFGLQPTSCQPMRTVPICCPLFVDGKPWGAERCSCAFLCSVCDCKTGSTDARTH